MKKVLMFVMLGIISFLGINSVSAREEIHYTGTYEASDFYLYFDEHIEAYETYKDNINHLIDYWEKNHSLEHPFYFIIGYTDFELNSNEEYWVYTLFSTDTADFFLQSSFLVNGNSGINGDDSINYYQYNSKTNEYTYSGVLTAFEYYLGGTVYIIDSNISPVFKQREYRYSQNGNTHIQNYDTIHLPDFSSTVSSLVLPSIDIKDNQIIPTLKSLYDGSYVTNVSSNYTEIDLNEYSYVILSLKDYTERDTFFSTMFIKGQLCLTTLYNYGLEEKKDYISGYQTQGCTYYHNNYTTYTDYIKSEDIKNHGVYYLTTNDKSKPNSVKIDNTIYDITYITSENENNPYVSIGGKNYPVLPYSSLTDSATLTEKNGITNTWECAKYDTDCLMNSSGINFDDIFTKPLEILKSLWTSITSIFNIIVEFITLLPPVMQSFLYLSFMLAIILGLLKLIL